MIAEEKPKANECNKEHTECTGSSGKCERPAGHDGSHRCSSCRGSF